MMTSGNSGQNVSFGGARLGQHRGIPLFPGFSPKRDSSRTLSRAKPRGLIVVPDGALGYLPLGMTRPHNFSAPC